MFKERSCPNCGADWQGEPIPEEDRHLYAEGTTHFSKLIGVEVRGKFDGVCYWECPECHVRWDRFTGEKIVTSQARRIAIQKGLNCKNCGKPKGDHQFLTLNCPAGRKHRTLGYTNFEKDKVWSNDTGRNLSNKKS